MLSPCEWAKAASKKLGAEFTLRHLPDGPMTRAKLIEAHAMPVDKHSEFPNEQFQFVFEGPIHGPIEDGHYLVDGAGVHETNLFISVNILGADAFYQACISCPLEIHTA